MNLTRVDLNLLVYLDVLLREQSVTRAAERLGITQPALSNGLKRLRDQFDDPLLVRTGSGMTPTRRAKELAPKIREILGSIEQAVAPRQSFDPASSERGFRIMASDYAEATLVAPLLDRLQHKAPKISMDILTPSDVSLEDIEQGKVDMALNRFRQLPAGFHEATVWRDGFACLMNAKNPALQDWNLKTYLSAAHIWVSKTGLGVGRGVNTRDPQRLGWVDEQLAEMGEQRNIRVFTRHYQAAARLARRADLIATLPQQMAALYAPDSTLAMRKPPFMLIPFELKLAWSPLLQHDEGHRWLRREILATGREVKSASSE